MVDQLILCPLCKNRKNLFMGPGSDSFDMSWAIKGTIVTVGPYRMPLELQCSLCQGTGCVSKENYDNLYKEIGKVKPERPNHIIDNPTRIIDLDDTEK